MSEPQSMMLGVPAGTEPVSERSLEEKPPVPEKPKRKRTVSGRIIATIDNEIYKVEMSEAGVTVRRSCKHHVDVKPMREIVDFVTGQGRLEFGITPQVTLNAGQTPFETLLESCIEFLAVYDASIQDGGAKYRGRFKLSESALRDQVETLALGKIQEVFETL